MIDPQPNPIETLKLRTKKVSEKIAKLYAWFIHGCEQRCERRQHKQLYRTRSYSKCELHLYLAEIGKIS